MFPEPLVTCTAPLMQSGEGRWGQTSCCAVLGSTRVLRGSQVSQLSVSGLPGGAQEGKAEEFA